MAAGTALSRQDKAFIRAAFANPTVGANMVSWMEAVDTLTGTETLFIDGVTAGTAAASKALVLDSSGAIDLITAKAIAGGDNALGITGQAQATTVNGGLVAIAGAASIAGATGNGGAVTIAGGASGSTAGTGGAGSLAGGLGTTTGAGGPASLTGGIGGSSTGDGGAAAVAGGSSPGSNADGGAASVTGGATTAGAAGTGGAVVMAGGANANTTNGAGGLISATGGAGKGTGAGGAAALVGGAAAGSGTGGAVNIDGGASGSGTTGSITVGTTSAEAVTIGRTGKTTTINGPTTIDTLSAGHGTGFVSTAFAPLTSRRTENGTIITEIKFDMDGLAVQGDTAKDVIGLSAAASSYFGRYVTATFGIVYRIEMICTVLPTQQTATIALDLDLGADDQALAQNETADDVVIDAGTVVAGNMYVTNVPALTPNDYLYLIEGAGTDGTTGEYSGGQFVIRFYGHAVMT